MPTWHFKEIEIQLTKLILTSFPSFWALQIGYPLPTHFSTLLLILWSRNFRVIFFLPPNQLLEEVLSLSSFSLGPPFSLSVCIHTQHNSECPRLYPVARLLVSASRVHSVQSMPLSACIPTPLTPHSTMAPCCFNLKYKSLCLVPHALFPAPLNISSLFQRASHFHWFIQFIFPPLDNSGERDKVE